MRILRKLYESIALRVYSTGKNEFEKLSEQRILRRATVGKNTRFYPGAEVQNLSQRVDRIQIGINCHISGMLLIYPYGGSIKIGDNCSLSPYSRIIACKRVEIGSRVLIAHNVNIIDNNSHPLDAVLRHEDFISSYEHGMREFDIKGAPIVIEDDVWIGYNSSIMKGVKIGRGAIIGAGSLVTKDVAPWTVNVGNPLRTIKQLEPKDVISKLK